MIRKTQEHTVLSLGNSLCLGGMVKKGTKFACVLMMLRVGQGLSVIWKQRIAATKNI